MMAADTDITFIFFYLRKIRKVQFSEIISEGNGLYVLNSVWP
jgi:hypothetical protein